MNKKQVRQILKDTDFVHTSGSPEELKAANYLKACCEAQGVKAWLEPFEVEMAKVKTASLTVTYANGKKEEIRCRGYRLCGSGEVEKAKQLYESGDTKALLRYFRICRCSRMEELHESQRKVDCLDFLIRQTVKTLQ